MTNEMQPIDDRGPVDAAAAAKMDPIYTQMLTRLDACLGGTQCFHTFSRLDAFWFGCEHLDHVIWLSAMSDCDRQLVARGLVNAARAGIDFCHDRRSLAVLNACEHWATAADSMLRKVAIDELHNAWYAGSNAEPTSAGREMRSALARLKSTVDGFHNGHDIAHVLSYYTRYFSTHLLSAFQDHRDANPTLVVPTNSDIARLYTRTFDTSYVLGQVARKARTVTGAEPAMPATTPQTVGDLIAEQALVAALAQPQPTEAVRGD